MNEEDSTLDHMSKTLEERNKFPSKRKLYSGDENNDLRKPKKHNDKGVRYACNECEYVATCSANLKRHKESKHEGKRYPCDECKYAATTTFQLKKHKESKHEGVRHLCDKCDESRNHGSSGSFVDRRFL